MGQRRKFSARYKREAVATPDAPGVTVSQIAAELGIGVNVLGRWRRELRRQPDQAFVGNGRSRDEDLSQLGRELARVTQERDFFARSGSVLGESVEVKYRMIQRCRDAFPIRPDVSLFAGVGEQLLRLGDAATECAGPGEREIGGADSTGPCGALRDAGERCGRHRVARLMRRADLQGVPQRRRWRTKRSGTPPAGTRNYLERDFTAPAPNTKCSLTSPMCEPPSTGCISVWCWICTPGWWWAGR